MLMYELYLNMYQIYDHIRVVVFCVTLQQCYSSTVLLFNSVTLQQCYSSTVLLCNSVPQVESPQPNFL
jgi:hypothetical protein